MPASRSGARVLPQWAELTPGRRRRHGPRRASRVANRGGERPAVGSAQAGRAVHGQDWNRDHADVSARRANWPSRSGVALRSTCSWPPTRASCASWPPRGSSSLNRFTPTPGARSSWRSITNWAIAFCRLDDLTKPEVKKIALAIRLSLPTAGRQAGSRARRSVGKARNQDRVCRVGATGPALRPEAATPRRRWSVAPSPAFPRSGRSTSTRSSTTRSSRRWASWRRRPRPADAERFAQFVLDNDGQSVLKEFGFMPPQTEEKSHAASPQQVPARAYSPTP